MGEQANESGSRPGIGRREILQRGGVLIGATALWSTPLVQTLGMRPAAASSPSEFCAFTGGRPLKMHWTYPGAGLVRVRFSQPTPSGGGSSNVYGDSYGAGSGSDVFEANIGSPTGGQNQNIYIEIWSVCWNGTQYVETLVMETNLHVSCSGPFLVLNEVYGGLTLVGGVRASDNATVGITTPTAETQPGSVAGAPDDFLCPVVTLNEVSDPDELGTPVEEQEAPADIQTNGNPDEPSSSTDDLGSVNGEGTSGTTSESTDSGAGASGGTAEDDSVLIDEPDTTQG